MERPGMRRGEATSALASCDSTWWSNRAPPYLPITAHQVPRKVPAATSTSTSKRATLKTLCGALHALLTCASTWAIITLNKGHRLQCRAHRPSWSGGEPRGKHVSMVTGPAGQQKPLSFATGLHLVIAGCFSRTGSRGQVL